MIRLPHLDVSAKKFRLSEMVGTTRPRITMFMDRFRNVGLIETNIDHFLTIKEKELTNYLALRTAGHVCGFRDNSFKGVQYWTETSPASDYIQYDGNSLWDWPGNALAGYLAQKKVKSMKRAAGLRVDHRKS